MRHHGLLELPRNDKRVANIFVRDAEIALPARIIGVGLGEPIGNDEFGSVGLQRCYKVTLSEKHVADLVVQTAETVLPVSVAGVGYGEPISNCQGGPVGRQ